MKNIPEKIPLECGGMPDISGAWIILQPIHADMQLVQSGHHVGGTYCNAEVKGTIEGTLFREGEEIILIGKWADQLGRGDFRVFIGNTSHNRDKVTVGRTTFQGNWKHSKSQSWDGMFVGNCLPLNLLHERDDDCEY
ncbi:MAG TPA: hypothetical protein VMY43_08340 [Methanothrix sp.]|nr:hypothetical protein [Methanothrix sp.]